MNAAWMFMMFGKAVQAGLNAASARGYIGVVSAAEPFLDGLDRATIDHDYMWITLTSGHLCISAYFRLPDQ